MRSSKLTMGTIKVYDTIFTVIGKKEKDENSYIEQMKEKLEYAIEDKVVIKGKWDDDI